MKDYAQNISEKKLFIINYEVKGTVIVVNTADGVSHTVPYSIEAEQKILSQMKNQVIEAKSLLESFSSEKKVSIVAAISSLALSGIIGDVIDISRTGELFAYLILVLGAAGIGMSTAMAWDCTEKAKDLAKNVMFNENEGAINKYIASNKCLISTLSTKGKEVITKNRFNPPILTLNDVHKMPFKDVKKLVKEATCDETFQSKLGF